MLELKCGVATGPVQAVVAGTRIVSTESANEWREEAAGLSRSATTSTAVLEVVTLRNGTTLRKTTAAKLQAVAIAIAIAIDSPVETDSVPVRQDDGNGQQTTGSAVLEPV